MERLAGCSFPVGQSRFGGGRTSHSRVLGTLCHSGRDMRMVFFCGKVSDEIGGGNETDPIFKTGL